MRRKLRRAIREAKRKLRRAMTLPRRELWRRLRRMWNEAGKPGE